jgi:hypothetical protein
MSVSITLTPARTSGVAPLAVYFDATATTSTAASIAVDVKAATPAAVATAVGALAVEGTVTVLQSLQLSNAAAAGKVDGADGTTVHLRNLGDTKNRVTATVDANGNRTAVTKSYD